MVGVFIISYNKRNERLWFFSLRRARSQDP